MTPKNNCGNLEECIKIFISWQWAIGIIMAWVAVVGSISYAVGTRLTTFEYTQGTLINDVDKLKTIDSKLDTLIMRTAR